MVFILELQLGVLVTFLLNKMSGVTITGVGGYLPPNVITNRDLSKKYNVTEE